MSRAGAPSKRGTELVESGAPSTEAKYLYCIIRCPQERGFDGAQAIGGRGDPVHTVAFEDLACVVSDSPDMKYDNTRANMMAHETVIEQVMKEFTVLPIRFGTITRLGTASPAENIRYKLLRSRFKEFQELHQEMEGRVELGLRALWRDEAAIFKEIAAENADIRKLSNSLAGRPPEATHFDRMHLGEMVKIAMDRKRDKEANNLLAAIRPIADRVRQNKTIMDRMVLNAAFLVHRDREQQCDEVVRRLGEELNGRIALKYSGPNPPFNFCEVVVTWEED